MIRGSLRSLSDHPLVLVTAGSIAAAAAVGVAAGIGPKYGLGLALGLVFVAIAINDVAAGVALLAFLSIVDAQGRLAKPAGALLALSWVAMISARRLQRRMFFETHSLLAYAMLLFVVWTGLSALWAEDSGPVITAVLRFAPNMILVAIAFDALQRREQAVLVLATIVVASAIAGAIGVVNPPPSSGGIDDAERVASTIGDANELAAALVAGTALAAAFAMRRATPSILRLGAAGAVAVSLFATFLTLSRGGLIALAAAMVASVLFSGRWRKSVAGAALMVVVVTVGYFALFASLPARERVTNVGGGTGRVDLWTIGERMVSAHPLNGVGAGNFRVSSIHYLLRPGLTHRADYIVSTPLVAHNTYLQIAAEEGVPAAILFGAILLFSLVAVLRAARNFAAREELDMEILCRGLAVGLVGYLTAMLFISEMYSKILWMLIALGPALLALSRQNPIQAAASRRR